MPNINTHGVFVTLGASNHSDVEREENDYYATDPRAVECLLDKVTFNHHIWECACGEGHISRVLESRGYDVTSTDLVDRGYGRGGSISSPNRTSSRATSSPTRPINTPRNS